MRYFWTADVTLFAPPDGRGLPSWVRIEPAYGQSIEVRIPAGAGGHITAETPAAAVAEWWRISDSRDPADRIEDPHTVVFRCPDGATFALYSQPRPPFTPPRPA